MADNRQQELAQKLVETTMLNDATMMDLIKDGEWEGSFSAQEVKGKGIESLLSEAKSLGLIKDFSIEPVENSDTIIIEYNLTEQGEERFNEIARTREGDHLDNR